MSEETDAAARLTAKEFHASPGVEDWRIVYGGAHAFYRVASLTDAVALVDAVAEIAAELGHDVDLDVRPHGVMIRTFTHRGGGLGPADAELARRVSEVARGRGHRPDVSRIQAISIAVAQVDGADSRPFWAAALGYETRGDAIASDPDRRLPHIWMDEIATAGRGRTHVDVGLPADQAEARVAAALAVGGRLADDSHAPDWWTLASPENHGVDIAGWPDVDG